MTTDPKKFYGTAYNDARATDLASATKYLDMAIRNEADGPAGERKVEMALSAALKAEAKAFSIAG